MAALLNFYLNFVAWKLAQSYEEVCIATPHTITQFQCHIVHIAKIFYQLIRLFL